MPTKESPQALEDCKAGSSRQRTPRHETPELGDRSTPGKWSTPKLCKATSEKTGGVLSTGDIMSLRAGQEGLGKNAGVRKTKPRWLLLRHRTHEQRRVDAPVEEVHPPVEVRSGGAAGRADLGDGLSLGHPLALLDQDARQVQERR